jgi:hypothetical protein
MQGLSTIMQHFESSGSFGSIFTHERPLTALKKKRAAAPSPFCRVEGGRSLRKLACVTDMLRPPVHRLRSGILRTAAAEREQSSPALRVLRRCSGFAMNVANTAMSRDIIGS